uniref:Uncharacterized protein n=1 Tax=Rhizophora mucronata TaxID=61149 RepID=A0A2P2PBQ1_RHIMU
MQKEKQRFQQHKLPTKASGNP